MRIELPIYESATELDNAAGRVYADQKLKRNSDGSIAIVPELRTLQDISGDLVEKHCHDLADRLLFEYTKVL
jgi:hypothetical protein